MFVTENMVGHKLGEFRLTRTFKGHAADKKAKKWRAAMESISNFRGTRPPEGLPADMVCGKPVDQALNILTFSPQKAAFPSEGFGSAIANAEHEGADIDEN